MKLRVAKKILLNPERYSGHQRYAAAHRLYRRAATFSDGEAALAALKLKPLKSFVDGDQQDLRRERLLGLHERGESVVYECTIEVPVVVYKPAYRKDGQAHNFNALPYPGFEPKSSEFIRYQVRTNNSMRGIKPGRRG